MKRLRWLITIPLALLLVVIAINNRHMVEFSLWPLGIEVRWPLFVLIYFGVLAGFAGGARVAFASSAHQHRRSNRRRAEKQAKKAAAGSVATPPATID